MRAALTLALALAAGLPALERPRDAPAAAAVLAPQAAVLSGRFEQLKTLKGFKRPLRSSGAFTLARDRGVLWRIEKPFPSAVCVDGKGLWQVEAGADGLKRTSLHRGDMSLVLGLVQKLLAGDRAALAQAFDVTEKAAPAGAWRLDLVPRDAALRRAIAGLEVEGAAHVQRVAWDEANGDRTVIVFSGLSERAALDAAEAGAFGG